MENVFPRIPEIAKDNVTYEEIKQRRRYLSEGSLFSIVYLSIHTVFNPAKFFPSETQADFESLIITPSHSKSY
jgi:hypothetical protein